jgi:alkylation response protein AidB-like acyl-CoA dehydrogenase
MDADGITIEPLHLLSQHDINQVYYDDVRVRADNLVGGENNGWSLIVDQLNHERVTLCSSGLLEQAYTEVRDWALATRNADGRRVVDDEWVQMNLARVRAGLDYLRLISWKVAGPAPGHPRRSRPPRCSAFRVSQSFGC